VILAILILAFIAGACIYGSVEDSNPSATIFGAVLLGAACVMAGRLM
jgi:hypothetical protein